MVESSLIAFYIVIFNIQPPVAPALVVAAVGIYFPYQSTQRSSFAYSSGERSQLNSASIA